MVVMKIKDVNKKEITLTVSSDTYAKVIMMIRIEKSLNDLRLRRG